MDELIQLLQTVKGGVDFKQEGLVIGGVLDSVTIFSVIAALERHYDIKIKPKYVTPENFDSAEAILELINELLDE